MKMPYMDSLFDGRIGAGAEDATGLVLARDSDDGLRHGHVPGGTVYAKLD